MNAETFLEFVHNLMPSRAVLLDHGLDDDEVRDIQSMFVTSRRGVAAPNGVSEVERMIIEFDCSRLEVGLIRFNERLERNALGTCFALCEADPLILLADGRVGLVDHAAPGSVHQLCASSAERFLDVLALALTLSERGEFTEEALVDCSNVAGGPECLEFCRMLHPGTPQASG